MADRRARLLVALRVHDRARPSAQLGQRDARAEPLQLEQGPCKHCVPGGAREPRPSRSKRRRGSTVLAVRTGLEARFAPGCCRCASLWCPVQVGVGYSWAEDGNYTTGDNETARVNLGVLQGLADQFPHIRSNDLYIAGESYAVRGPMLS